MIISDDIFAAGAEPQPNNALDSADMHDISDSIPLLPLAAAVQNPYDDRVSRISEPQPLADFIQEQRTRIIAAILAGNIFSSDVACLSPCSNSSESSVSVSAVEVSRDYSDLIDAVVRRMFCLACESTGANPLTLQMAIVATGGYGRRELAPFSDIDLSFVPLRDGDAATDRVVRELFRMVTDVFIAKCGLEIGYAYRLLSDCSSLDHQTASGLLDARFITGSQRLFIRFEDAFWDGFNSPEFIFTKIDERNELLKKHGMLPRSVEPNLKEALAA